ncbi:hypothetical protein [Desulfovibrio oxyclinae]|uniref:hypothetical protein n=1 Tax=Desulfovibrio oxyclinae TaxID=63560 RepID=UPI00036412CE|nr:hypothetical protein [Desulfovibrio oxyclinae]
MKILKKFVYVLCLLAFFAVAFGCEQEGPAEKAGKQVDQAIEEAGDSIEEAGDKLEESVDN